jgi:hypothetical protein
MTIFFLVGKGGVRICGLILNAKEVVWNRNVTGTAMEVGLLQLHRTYHQNRIERGLIADTATRKEPGSVFGCYWG